MSNDDHPEQQQEHNSSAGQSHGHGHSHADSHGHGHGHENDQGLKAMLRYARWAPRMLFSDLNRTVVDLIDPQPGERLVDIGAGMGPGAVHAAKSGAEVIAVEPTPFMRRILTVRCWLQRTKSKVTVVDGAAERIPAADGSVDAVMAVNTMHHWVDLEAAVGEIGRVLKPGGRILMLDEDFQNPEHPDFDQFGGHSEENSLEHHGFTMVDASELGALLTEAGLVEVDAGDGTIADRPVISVTGRKAR